MPIARIATTALLAATISACMSTVRVAPAEYLAQNRPLQMLVVDEFGDMYVLEQPSMVGDNLVGIEVGTPDRISLPISQVQEAVVRQKSPTKTAFLVGTLTAMTAAGIVFVATGGSDKVCKGIGDGATAIEVGGKDHCDNTGAGGEASGV